MKQDINLQNDGKCSLNDSSYYRGHQGVLQIKEQVNYLFFKKVQRIIMLIIIGVSVGDLASAGNGLFGVSMLHRPTDLKYRSTPATLITTLDGSTTNTSLSIASRWVFNFLSKHLFWLGFSLIGFNYKGRRRFYDERGWRFRHYYGS